MKIYVFHNVVRNEVYGDFYFVASDRLDANSMAAVHQKDHNIKCGFNRNYTIEFDFEDVDEFPIVSGYLPLNRS